MQTHPPFPAPRSTERSAFWFKFLLCCFAGIVALRIFLVERFAASIAWGDDLDGIARRILLPWENGTLTWTALFATHNGDHRIVATRLWEILWYAINGSWDPKLVMIVKAPIYAAAATIFIHLLVGGLERRRFLAGALLAVLFAFPFAYANMIWAFQSQFDFFLLAAALGWLALLRGRPVVALGFAAASLLALGSGPIIAASYVPFFVVAWLEKRWPLRRAAAFCAASLAILVVGLASPTADRRPHVGTPAEKALTFARIYAWPHSNLLSIVERLPETARYVPAPVLRFPSEEQSWLLRFAQQLHRHPGAVAAFNVALALLVLAPTLAVTLAVVRRRIPLAPALGPLALAGFAFLMIAATAVARARQITIEVRFLDHVALAGFSSLACGFLLLTRTLHGRRWLAVWAAVMGLGYTATMAVTLAQLSRRSSDASLAILQRYFATTPHDHAALTEGENFRRFIVGDDPTQFMAELDEPGMERVLPRAVTAPGSPPGRAAQLAYAVAKAGPLFVLLAAGGGWWIVVLARRRCEYRVGRGLSLATPPAGA
jgi:hypothetical protein